MSCDVGEATEGLENEVNSPSFPSLHLRHSSFSNHSVASLTSQLILQLFFRFFYVTGSSLMSPDEPPMLRAILSDLRTDRLCHYALWRHAFTNSRMAINKRIFSVMTT